MVGFCFWRHYRRLRGCQPQRLRVRQQRVRHVSRSHLLPNFRLIRNNPATPLWVAGTQEDAEKMTLNDMERAYMSWRGTFKEKDAHTVLRSVDLLYFDLFAVKPWISKKQRRKENHHA